MWVKILRIQKATPITQIEQINKFPTVMTRRSRGGA